MAAVYMNVDPWKVVFGVGFLIYFGIRHTFIERTRGTPTIARHQDSTEVALLSLMSVGALALPVLYLFTPWLAFANYLLIAWAPWCGVAVMAGALWLFWRSHTDLGRHWSQTLELRQEHRLVRHGVYRTIRHPMYAAVFLFSAAQGLLLANWLAGWSAFVAFAVMYLIRTPREERMLREHFGAEYDDYVRQTGRLWPRW